MSKRRFNMHSRNQLDSMLSGRGRPRRSGGCLNQRASCLPPHWPIVPASAHDVIALINAHLGELREELAVLEKASAQVIAAAKAARSQA